ncbi:MAG: NPCBM/NEW2 domain-containing protein [Planctomycetota bacterium]
MNCLFCCGHAVVTTFTVVLGLSLPVEVETVSGDKVAGKWNGAEEGAIRLMTSGGNTAIPIDKLVSLRPADLPPTKTKPPVLVTITGGSSVRVQDFALTDSTFTLEPRRQEPIQLPVKQVRSVRFRLESAKTDPQWLGLLEAENRRDLMVIRRPGDQLDPIEGIVLGLTNETLKFELDGEAIDAPIDRLEGIILRGSASSGSSKVRVEDIYGSVFAVSRLEPSSGSETVEVDLGGKSPHPIPLGDIRSITWASGRVLLARVDAADQSLTPLLKTKVDADLFAAWFAPRSEDDDLVATAGGKIEFRVDDGFRVLAGSVIKDADVIGGDSVVRIVADDKVAWEESLTDDQPKGFRVEIANVRRVRFEVLSGKDGDVGDRVRFLNLRFLK